MKQQRLRIIGMSLILLSFLIAVLVYGRIYYRRWHYQVNHTLSERPTLLERIMQNSSNSEPTIAKEAENTPIEPLSKSFGLVIPKISLNVPVVANVSGVIGKEYYEKLKLGVAHQEGTPTPDKGGNTVIFGHSSAVPGVKSTEYSEAFLLLDKLEIGNQIELYYQQQKYTYLVEKKREVSEGEISIINNTKDRRITLFTCWPPGTDSRRLVITAKAM